MPIITSVEVQKKDPHRFNIYLDGQFAFGADEDLVVNFRLLKGKAIKSEDLEKLLFEAEVGKLMDRLYGLLGRRDRSEKEIRDYLRTLSFKRKLKEKDELSEVVIESLINRLKQKGLINDVQFAQNWAESRRKSKLKGVQGIKMELFQKGIDREVIEQVLENNSQGEGQLAEQALFKKMKTWQHLPELEFKQKALQFLMRKGFAYDLARETIDNLLKKE